MAEPCERRTAARCLATLARRAATSRLRQTAAEVLAEVGLAGIEDLEASSGGRPVA